MGSTILHLVGEAFELARRASTPEAVRRRLIRQENRAYERFDYWTASNERKGRDWKKRRVEHWRRRKASINEARNRSCSFSKGKEQNGA